jgi:hypothetical protein
VAAAMLLWFFPVSFLLFVEGRVEKVRESKLASFLTLLGMVWLRWCMKRFEEKTDVVAGKRKHFLLLCTIRWSIKQIGQYAVLAKGSLS